MSSTFFYLRSLRNIGMSFWDSLVEWKQRAVEEVKFTRFITAVLSTPPIVLPHHAKVSVVMLSCHRDLFMGLLALKSMAHYLKFPFTVTILDDGTFSTRDLSILRSHLCGVRIISRSEQETAFLEQYSRQSHVLEYLYLPYVRKKAGIQFAEGEKVLLCDSDVLFFGPAKEVENWAKQDKACLFLDDVSDSYFLSKLETKHFFRLDPISRVNSGLVGLPRTAFDPVLLEVVIKEYDRAFSTMQRPPQMQLYFAILFAQLKKRQFSLKRLPAANYVVSSDPSKYANCTLGHYVRTVRQQYFADAKKLIAQLKNS